MELQHLAEVSRNEAIVFGHRLREGVKAVLNRVHSDKEFRHAMRVNDQRRVPWAKTWMEEIYPSSLLADRLGLAHDATFCWTPNGAADVEFRPTERAIKIQCTTAFPHWPNSLGKQGGHLHKLEMREQTRRGTYFRAEAFRRRQRTTFGPI